ncbi:MAG: type I-E CRISPR-associated protein Cas6/Cse3/CasE [Candidatus Electrothrix sp. ATG2]|nr:type I-E CRISPR-associated protein Cas6/Cse3/CasE [Candidatus Electrothrix sp. ATG2]
MQYFPVSVGNLKNGENIMRLGHIKHNNRSNRNRREPDMFFSKMTFRDHAVSPEDRMRIFQSPYALHQEVWRLFSDSPDRKRDFIYRLDKDGLRPVVYSVSDRKPEGQSRAWQVAAKEYAPKLLAGEELAFLLRANPVVTRKNADGRRQRHDVVMDRKKALQEQGMTKKDMPSTAILAHEAGQDWLVRRTEQHGFAVQQQNILVERYRQERFGKQQNKGTIQFSLLDFSGRLTVTDPELFTRALCNGIGPAKGFGCGMLLVRRV